MGEDPRTRKSFRLPPDVVDEVAARADASLRSRARQFEAMLLDELARSGRLGRGEGDAEAPATRPRRASGSEPNPPIAIALSDTAWSAIETWADEDVRNLPLQVEFMLRRALGRDELP